MSVRDEERNLLEEYSFSVQGFHDSLRGLNSAVEEARARCDKARWACEKLRTKLEREKTQRTPPGSSATCPERCRLQQQWGLAAESYHDALNNVQLSSGMVHNGEEREQIERTRIACIQALKVLEDHERAHRCGQRASIGSAVASSA